MCPVPVPVPLLPLVPVSVLAGRFQGSISGGGGPPRGEGGSGTQKFVTKSGLTRFSQRFFPRSLWSLGGGGSRGGGGAGGRPAPHMVLGHSNISLVGPQVGRSHGSLNQRQHLLKGGLGELTRAPAPAAPELVLRPPVPSQAFEVLVNEPARPLSGAPHRYPMFAPGVVDHNRDRLSGHLQRRQHDRLWHVGTGQEREGQCRSIQSRKGRGRGASSTPARSFEDSAIVTNRRCASH